MDAQGVLSAGRQAGLDLVAACAQRRRPPVGQQVAKRAVGAGPNRRCRGRGRRGFGNSRCHGNFHGGKRRPCRRAPGNLLAAAAEIGEEYLASVSRKVELPQPGKMRVLKAPALIPVQGVLGQERCLLPRHDEKKSIIPLPAGLAEVAALDGQKTLQGAAGQENGDPPRSAGRLGRGRDAAAVGRDRRLGQAGEGDGDGARLPLFHAEQGEAAAVVPALDAIKPSRILVPDRMRQPLAMRKPGQPAFFHIEFVEIGKIAESAEIIACRQ